MDRTEYTTCMIPYMKGGGPDRKERFCIGAKICSKKANDESEAKRLCAEAAANPKPPKAKRIRGSKIDTAALAACVIKTLDGSEPTLATLTPIIANCTGQKTKPIEPVNRKEFFKKCYKENPMANPFGSRAGFRELKQLQSMCAARWKEQEVAI